MNNSMMIKTYDDLTAERARLEASLVLKKQRVVSDWEAVKIELEPVSNAFGVIGKMSHSSATSPLLKMGLKFASDVLLKNFVLAKAGWITRLAVPFVMKNYSSHLITDNSQGILSKLKKIGRIFTSGKVRNHEQPQ